ncbi:GtrA family protein [Catenuloplanes atrovinosus]|uniref:Flippase GtrA n=1 Tax=Catenuloplanes atrovinosus TaxID=137266 RepID=A0AAE3YY80_9ACTN|nr:GtrA family protein [Catenuloplanes atrovinosus]MDR7280780.1 putative flippase GtrA [Catenuloplanes atrovinosus]
MRLLRLLPERWQKLIREAAKFGIVGGVNFGINFAIFNILILTVMQGGQLKANVIATGIATLTSYLMNRHWTYRDRPKEGLHREYLLFFFFNAVALGIESGVLAAFKYGLGVETLVALNIAKFGGQVLGTLFRFWSYRTFVFRKVPAGQVDHLHIDHIDPHAMADLDLTAELAEHSTHHDRDGTGKDAEPRPNGVTAVAPQQRTADSNAVIPNPTS